MKQINLRLPDEVHERLRLLAEQERRSLNNMVITLIERATTQEGQDSPTP